MRSSTYATLLVTLVAIFGLCSVSEAQIWKRVSKEIKNRVGSKVVNEAGSATDKAVDKAMGKSKAAASGNQASAGLPSSSGSGSVSDYKSYDFVPGDRIIFQPDLSGEADGELPARFVVKRGNAEIQTYKGEKILHLNSGGYVSVTPLMDNEGYLPEQFTLEFDLMYENDKSYFDQVNDFWIQFYTATDDNYDGYGVGKFIIHSNEATVLGKHGTPQNKVSAAVATALQTNNLWHHVALYFRKTLAKAYIGGARVAATNAFPAGAAKFAFRTDGNYGFKVKNIRLAAGGDDKYNKIVTEGKFITHGIQFDVNKSTIKPESMGALNEIAKLMKEHSDLRFEVQGHTDSDGSDQANLTLSQSRADAVKAQLLKAGIEAARLTTKGMGKTVPMDSNDTAEGKANNRRVEFVKL